MKKKNVIIFIIFFLVIISFSNTVFAEPNEDNLDGSAETSGSFSENLVNSMENARKIASNPTTDSAFMYLLSRIFTLLQFIGTGISIIIVTKLGITYMISSIEEKAKIKEKAVPIVIGSVLIVATVNIMKFIQVLVENSL